MQYAGAFFMCERMPMQDKNPSKLNVDEYAEFLAKFEVKKTTDDCYTPPIIYQAVLKYVDEHIISLKDKTVVRPFYPNGDYQADAQNYDENTIVIDNPPFSLLSKIKAFYQKNKIKFFLFCPSLTQFGNSQNNETMPSYLIIDVAITYANGAKVSSGFVTNLLDDVAILCDKKLNKLIEEAEEKNTGEKKTLPKYSYPDHVVTSARLKSIAQDGYLKIMKDEVLFIRQLDSQKPHKKTLFGGGFLVTDEVAERIKAERIKAERIKAERSIFHWQLSDREIDLVKTISCIKRNTKPNKNNKAGSP